MPDFLIADRYHSIVMCR